MTEMTKRILDKVEARLVELGTDAGNVSGDDDVPPPLESDISSDEGENEDSSDNDDSGQDAGVKRKVDSYEKF